MTTRGRNLKRGLGLTVGRVLEQKGALRGGGGGAPGRER